MLSLYSGSITDLANDQAGFMHVIENATKTDSEAQDSVSGNNPADTAGTANITPYNNQEETHVPQILSPPKVIVIDTMAEVQCL